MRNAEYDQDDGHDGEGGDQDILGAVEPPEPWTVVQWTEFVACLDQSPSSNAELISAHEPEQAGDDGKIDTCQAVSIVHSSSTEGNGSEGSPDLIFVPLLKP